MSRNEPSDLLDLMTASWETQRPTFMYGHLKIAADLPLICEFIQCDCCYLSSLWVAGPCQGQEGEGRFLFTILDPLKTNIWSHFIPVIFVTKINLHSVSTCTTGRIRIKGKEVLSLIAFLTHVKAPISSFVKGITRPALPCSTGGRPALLTSQAHWQEMMILKSFCKHQNLCNVS